MDENKIQKAWEDYHKPIELFGELSNPPIVPAFRRGYVDGYDQATKDSYKSGYEQSYEDHKHAFEGMLAEVEDLIAASFYVRAPDTHKKARKWLEENIPDSRHLKK